MLIILEFGHIYNAMKNYLKILLLLILAGCKQGDLEFTQGGKEFSINYDNEIVVLNVWADWCPPCIKEFPYFNKLNELEGVTVLGFHFDQFDLISNEDVMNSLTKFDVQFKNLKTDPREIWGMDIPDHVPTTYIIENGEITKELIKPQTYDSLLAELGLSQ